MKRFRLYCGITFNRVCTGYIKGCYGMIQVVTDLFGIAGIIALKEYLNIFEGMLCTVC